jgi:GH43 family beta-xylosidase
MPVSTPQAYVLTTPVQIVVSELAEKNPKYNIYCTSNDDNNSFVCYHINEKHITKKPLYDMNANLSLCRAKASFEIQKEYFVNNRM